MNKTTVTIKLDLQEYQTIYTAVKLEYYRNYGKDESVETLLKNALKVLENSTFTQA